MQATILPKGLCSILFLVHLPVRAYSFSPDSREASCLVLPGMYIISVSLEMLFLLLMAWSLWGHQSLSSQLWFYFFKASIMSQSAKGFTKTMLFWSSAMALKEKNQMATVTGWSRTGINFKKHLYLKFRKQLLWSVFRYGCTCHSVPHVDRRHPVFSRQWFSQSCVMQLWVSRR